MKHGRHVVMPRIRLEVLGKKSIVFVLVLTYLAVVLAILSGIYELRIGTNTVHQNGAPCVETPPASSGDLSAVIGKPCTIVGEDFQQWTGYLQSWSPPYGTFSLDASVAIDNYSGPYYRDMRYIVTVYGAHREEDNWKAIRTIANQTRSLRCYAGISPCVDFTIFEKADISCFSCADQLLTFQRFMIVVTYTGNEHLLDFNATVTYTFSYSGFVYRTAEVVLRLVMSGITAGLGIYYISQIWCGSEKLNELLPEQRYVVVLLACTILYQDPLLLGVVTTGNNGLHFASRCMVVTGFSIMMMVFLFLFDSIKLNRTNQRSVDFYMLKLVFGFVFWCVCIVLESLKLMTYDPDVQQFDANSVDMICVLVLEYVKIALLVAWLLWMMMIQYQTRNSLKQMSYLRTRFRQLPFRYFLLQGWCVLSFLVVTSVVKLASSAKLSIDSGQDLLGVVFIVTVYNGLLAFVYLPPYHVAVFTCLSSRHGAGHGQYTGIGGMDSRDSLHMPTPLTRQMSSSLSAQSRSKRRTSYSPALAAMMLRYSILSYYDPAGHTTESGWGPIEEEVHVVDFMSDLNSDTHVLLVRWAGMLVVAFRGTSSKTNWLSNARFKQVPLPEDINKTTISRMLPPRVHQGFWDAYCGIRERLLDRVRKYMRDPRNRRVRITCTGHSLGGALATFAAYDITMQLGIDGVRMYNFGSPRVGNQFWSLYYDSAVPFSYRIVYDGDVVAGVPMAILLYRHIGTEIVVDRYGNAIVAPTFVEQVFRARSKRGIQAHMCSSYEAAMRACIKEFVDYWSEHEHEPPLATLRSMVDAEMFSDAELLQLAGLTEEGGESDEPSLAVPVQHSHEALLDVEELTATATVAADLFSLMRAQTRSMIRRSAKPRRNSSAADVFAYSPTGVHEESHEDLHDSTEQFEMDLFSDSDDKGDAAVASEGSHDNLWGADVTEQRKSSVTPSSQNFTDVVF